MGRNYVEGLAKGAKPGCSESRRLLGGSLKGSGLDRQVRTHEMVEDWQGESRERTGQTPPLKGYNVTNEHWERTGQTPPLKGYSVTKGTREAGRGLRVMESHTLEIVVFLCLQDLFRYSWSPVLIFFE